MQELKKVKCIAEVGSNFNNDLDMAKRYVRACAEAGADAVKFQTLKKNLIISSITRVKGAVVPYPIFDIFKSSELPELWHYELKKEADAAGIEFISTPFYLDAVDLLIDVGVKTFKVASGDITYFPLLERIGKTGKDVLLSTGASTNVEIQKAVDVLRKNGAGGITLLHCVSNYPPKWDEMNITAIPTMAKVFGLPIGLSDHTPGATIPVASVALGATVVEKHVTFGKDLPGPDHAFAMTMDEFADMVIQVRRVERALGHGCKEPSKEEVPRIKRIRRGLYDKISGEPTDNTKNANWLRPEHGVTF
jgi:N,N'-diacetyllegionaminate synthase